MDISLVKVVSDNLKDVIELAVDEKQKEFMQDNVVSIAAAAVSVYSHLHYNRAICVGDKIVGFLIDIYYHPENEPAKNLYAYHGFKETGFRDNGNVIAEMAV